MKIQDESANPPQRGEYLTFKSQYRADSRFIEGAQVMVDRFEIDNNCLSGLRIWFYTAPDFTHLCGSGLDSTWFNEYALGNPLYHAHIKARTPLENSIDVPGTLKMNWDLKCKNNLLQSALQNLHGEVIVDLGCGISSGRLAGALRIAFDVLELLKR